MADQVADFRLDNGLMLNGGDIVNWADFNVPASHTLTQTGPFTASFEGTETPNSLPAALVEGEKAMVSPTGERFVLAGSGEHTMVAIFAPENGNVVGEGDSVFKASVIATTTNVVQHGGMVLAYHDDAVHFGFDDPAIIKGASQSRAEIARENKAFKLAFPERKFSLLDIEVIPNGSDGSLQKLNVR
ncbi:hypothetical protein N8813_02360 [bacterium]|nr:hypothetical protein [bacterium]MDA7673096.1 hypothetical protein [Verrucomicrobiales bacterium]MDC0311970.1 hypothetical protein [bacterium]